MNEMMVKCLFEFIGTAILVLFGDGVVASNVLKKSKGENGGWVVVTLAWGLAVMLGVFISGPYSGAHLNPAVTLGLAAAGTFSWSLVVPYIVAQMLGGISTPRLEAVRIEHPSGGIDVVLSYTGVNGETIQASVVRTARRLFSGYVYATDSQRLAG